MKKTSILLLIISIFSLQNATAQSTLDEIIQKNIKARGGEKLLKEIQSIEMEMTMENPMGEITARTYTLNNEATRMEMDIMGTTNYFLVTQDGGWRYFPIQGMKEPKMLTEEQHIKMKSQLDINGELFDYQNKEKMIEFSGEDEVNGEECLVLTVTDPEKPESPKKVFISGTSFLIVKEEVEIEGPEGMQTISTFYKDYKTTKEGHVFARKIESPQGVATITKLKVNSEINPAKFEVPKADRQEHNDDEDDHKGHKH